MELMIMSYACKTSCARSIIVSLGNLILHMIHKFYISGCFTLFTLWVNLKKIIENALFISLDSKQSKQKKRGCIAMKLVAQMLVKAGLTHLITVDLHQKEIQGFFDIPVDNLRASPFLVDYIQEQV